MKNLTNILLFSPLAPPSGGIASWTSDYMREMHKHGVGITMINTALIGNRKKDPQARLRVIEEITRTCSIFSSLIMSLLTRKHDISHLNSAGGTLGLIRDLVSLLLLRLARTPTVTHFHCNVPDKVTSFVGRLAFRALCKYSSAIIVLNRSSAIVVQHLIGEKCYIIPNFVTSALDDEKVISETLHSIVFVGHVCYRKGVREVLDVANRMPSMKFTLIGPVSTEFVGIPLPGNVKFTGELSRAETHELLLLADLFLLPSHSEGFPMALLEAMAAGLPIVATRVGAVPDMVDKVGARLVDVGNVNQIVHSINSFRRLETRSLASRSNLSRVKKSYLGEIVIEDLLRIYRSVTCQKLGEEY